MRTTAKRVLLLAKIFSALLLAQTPGPPPGIVTKILMQEPLGDTQEPTMALFVLTVAAGVTIPAHSHTGSVFAYILQGDIENQVEPGPLTVYHPGDVFRERPKQVHSLLRNLSKTESAKILIFQNTGAVSAAIKPLLQEPLANAANQEVTVMTLVAAPGADSTGAHQHPGPVFAYVLKGEIENQVDPGPPTVFRAGDVFHEPPMHAHRVFRNLSKTEPAEVLIFQIGKKGEPRAIGVQQ